MIFLSQVLSYTGFTNACKFGAKIGATYSKNYSAVDLTLFLP